MVKACSRPRTAIFRRRRKPKWDENPPASRPYRFESGLGHQFTRLIKKEELVDTSKWRILQVNPGDGWIAVMKQTEGAGRGTVDNPLIGWALVTNDQNVNQMAGLMLGPDRRAVIIVEGEASFMHYH